MKLLVRRAPLLLERTQKNKSERNAQGNEYGIVPYQQCRIRLDTGVYRWGLPFPFPASHTILKKAQIRHMTNLHTSMVLSLILSPLPNCIMYFAATPTYPHKLGEWREAIGWSGQHLYNLSISIVSKQTHVVGS